MQTVNTRPAYGINKKRRISVPSHVDENRSATTSIVSQLIAIHSSRMTKGKFAPFGRQRARKNLNISWENIWVAGAPTGRDGRRLSFILSIFLRVTLWFITQKSDRIKCAAFNSLTPSASSAKSPKAHFDGPPNWVHVMWVHVTRRDCTFRICMVFLNVTETITIINALAFRAKSHEPRGSHKSNIIGSRKKIYCRCFIGYLNNVVRYSAAKTRTFAQWLHLLVQQVNSNLENYYAREKAIARKSPKADYVWCGNKHGRSGTMISCMVCASMWLGIKIALTRNSVSHL